MRFMQKIKNHFEKVDQMEAIKAEYYAKGQDDATSRFLSQQSKMTSKIEELTAQNIDFEHRLRTSADQRIERMEKLHDEKCTSCRQNLEAERQRLLRRQKQLATKISEFEEVWLCMYQHANNIIDEHDVLLRSSSRLVSSRNILIDFKRRVDDIIEKSAPLLSIELQDSSKDKTMDDLRPPINGNGNGKGNGKEKHHAGKIQ